MAVKIKKPCSECKELSDIERTLEINDAENMEKQS